MMTINNIVYHGVPIGLLTMLLLLMEYQKRQRNIDQCVNCVNNVTYGDKGLVDNINIFIDGRFDLA